MYVHEAFCAQISHIFVCNNISSLQKYCLHDPRIVQVVGNPRIAHAKHESTFCTAQSVNCANPYFSLNVYPTQRNISRSHDNASGSCDVT